MANTTIIFTDSLKVAVDEEPQQVAETLSKVERFAQFTRRGKPVYVGADRVAYIMETPEPSVTVS